MCRVLIPPPEGRGGRDSKRGGMKAASVGRRLSERRLVSGLVGVLWFMPPLDRSFEIAICDFKIQSFYGVVPVAEPLIGEWL